LQPIARWPIACPWASQGWCRCCRYRSQPSHVSGDADVQWHCDSCCFWFVGWLLCCSVGGCFCSQL
jgi:hypothetical protein